MRAATPRNRRETTATPTTIIVGQTRVARIPIFTTRVRPRARYYEEITKRRGRRWGGPGEYERRARVSRGDPSSFFFLIPRGQVLRIAVQRSATEKRRDLIRARASVILPRLSPHSDRTRKFRRPVRFARVERAMSISSVYKLPIDSGGRTKINTEERRIPVGQKIKFIALPANFRRRRLRCNARFDMYARTAEPTEREGGGTESRKKNIRDQTAIINIFGQRETNRGGSRRSA